MLKVFSLDIYALIDPGPTSLFVTPLVAKKIDILPDIFYETFMVSTPMHESVVTKRVNISFLIMFPNRVSYVDLVEL